MKELEDWLKRVRPLLWQRWQESYGWMYMTLQDYLRQGYPHVWRDFQNAPAEATPCK
jgi:hypothetical protein